MQKNRMMKQHDLTTGDITKGIWSFAVPLMLGNVMQQLYNLVDTWVVGTYLGNYALAAVGLMNLHFTPAYHNREKMQERYDELEP